MKTKITRVKRPKNMSLFFDRVQNFSRNVEKLSEKKRKPAEYTIVDQPPAFIDTQLTMQQNAQYTLCLTQQNY
jgi:hypothetical protein